MAVAWASPLFCGPLTLPQVRGRLYELLSSCIPADTVMVYLVRSLLAKCPPPVRLETLHYAAIYEHRMQVANSG